MDFGVARIVFNEYQNQVLILGSERSSEFAHQFIRNTDTVFRCESCRNFGKTRSLTVKNGRIVERKHQEDDHHIECRPQMEKDILDRFQKLGSTSSCFATDVSADQSLDRTIPYTLPTPSTSSYYEDISPPPLRPGLRIDLIPTDTDYPFILHRRQFPVIPTFAMTINKSQGQTFTTVGIYLPNPVFSHGPLYVTFSRATSAERVMIQIIDSDKQGELKSGKYFTPNVVYKCGLFRAQATINH